MDQSLGSSAWTLWPAVVPSLAASGSEGKAIPTALREMRAEGDSLGDGGPGGDRQRQGVSHAWLSRSCNGSATTQLDNHLLAVAAGASVAHLLQRAGSLGQQHSPLAWRGEEGERKVATSE